MLSVRQGVPDVRHRHVEAVPQRQQDEVVPPLLLRGPPAGLTVKNQGRKGGYTGVPDSGDREGSLSRRRFLSSSI